MWDLLHKDVLLHLLLLALLAVMVVTVLPWVQSQWQTRVVLDVVLALPCHKRRTGVLVQPLILQQGMGVPQFLPVSLAPPKIVAVVMGLYPNVAQCWQLSPPEKLQLPLAKLLRPFVLLRLWPWFRIYLLVVRVP